MLLDLGNWYSIGVYAGLGTAIGVALAGFLAGSRAGLLVSLVAGAVGGALLGAWVAEIEEAAAAGFGGATGALGASEVVRGALRRGGTWLALAALVAVAALGLAGLAFVPVVGYLEAVVLPAVAARLRRRAGRTYAGLRILARD